MTLSRLEALPNETVGIICSNFKFADTLALSQTSVKLAQTIAPFFFHLYTQVFGIINKFLIELHPRTREMQDRFKAIFEACGYKVDYYDFNGSIYCYK